MKKQQQQKHLKNSLASCFLIWHFVPLIARGKLSPLDLASNTDLCNSPSMFFSDRNWGLSWFVVAFWLALTFREPKTPSLLADWSSLHTVFSWWSWHACHKGACPKLKGMNWWSCSWWTSSDSVRYLFYPPRGLPQYCLGQSPPSTDFRQWPPFLFLHLQIFLHIPGRMICMKKDRDGTFGDTLGKCQRGRGSDFGLHNK